MTLFSLPSSTLSLFLYKTLTVYFALKSMSADAILLSKYKKNRPENAFQEVVSTREVYGENDVFFRLKIFRVLWETPESRFGSFAGWFPGPRSFRVFWETHAWCLNGYLHCTSNLSSKSHNLLACLACNIWLKATSKYSVYYTVTSVGVIRDQHVLVWCIIWKKPWY